MEDCLLVYTDGSSAPNPRKGGVAFRMIFPSGKILNFSPYGYLGATNNEMELQACILALKEVFKVGDIENSKGIIVFTDSQYVVNNYKNAMFLWPKKKWIRSNDEPVLNATQWKELVRLMKRIWATFHIQVSFEKVEAHSGHVDNETVDKLAKSSRKGPTPNRISVSKVRKSKTNKKTEKGSIRGEGQRIRIRAVTTQWLPVQKDYRVRCEVLSKKSPYFGNMDFFLSKELLDAGHVYDLILEGGLDHCRVKKIIREVKPKI